MKLICESCGHGYPHTSVSCIWCGALASFAHTRNDVSCVDTECYINYWLCRFSTGEIFEMFPGRDLDTAGLIQTLSKYTIVSFNGRSYDIPMIEAAINGASTEQLKQLSDWIIIHNERIYHKLNWLDHIDLIDVLPGQSSLKAYGAKRHTQTLQDLPYSPNITTDWHERYFLKEYCGNDIRITEELYEQFKPQLKLREDISDQYHIDVRSKSDPQIAEAVMKKLLPFDVVRPVYPVGSEFYYRPPAWLKFINLDLIEQVTRFPFSVNENGGVAPHPSMEFMNTPVRIGDTTYTMGIGGLHSNEQSVTHYSDADTEIRDHDVASYYPSLVLVTGIQPAQIGSAFSSIYRDWYDRRLDAKKSGDKNTANTLKTLLNGTFGKLGSKYSIFYAPSDLIQVTITGQLALLMLIECLELHAIPVISANTDGIVLKCPRRLSTAADHIIKTWEQITGFETEQTNYTMLASRDVNSYIAIKPDGEVKLKGAYAPAEPGPSGWPNPTGQICVDAVVAFLTSGTPISNTIRDCQDIRKFLYVRAVRGGGALVKTELIPKKTSKREQTRLCEKYGFTDYEALREWSMRNAEYLGKIVRWYYAHGSQNWIHYASNGNQVPMTQGCAPLMTLPDTLPDDIDYQWYENEAMSILKQIGVIK